jgi:hypothetical protein
VIDPLSEMASVQLFKVGFPTQQKVNNKVGGRKLKKNFLTFLAILLVFSLAACGSRGGSSDGAPASESGVGGTVSATRLDLTAESSVLETNGADSTTLTIITRDESNAALGDIEVDISASAGLLSASQVTTDANGTATVEFSPGPEKENQVINITAATTTLSKTLPITLVGTTLSLTAGKSSLLAGVNDNTTLKVTARDANGNPIPNAGVTLSSALGNTLSTNGAAGSSIPVTTDNNGQATATLTALNATGEETITASGLGAQSTISIIVTNAQFGFTSPAEGSTIAVDATTGLTVTWTDAAGSAVAGQSVNFFTTGGYFDGVIGKVSTIALTDASGQATVDFTAGNTTTLTEITVTNSEAGADTLQLLVASINPTQLSLQASPSVLAPSIGGTSSSSTITATVRDANAQAVIGETVIFTLIQGPGGGESISPGTAVTDTGGHASVTFTSGSATSAQDGVVIRATLLSNPTIFADTNLTIGQQAASVVLAGTNKIEAVTIDGNEIGYALPFSVLVVDNNGNPIENAVVSLGIHPLFFYTGTSSGSRTGKFMNEDDNRNGILDLEEDGAPGWDNPEASRNDPIDTIWYSGSVGTLADTSSGSPNGRLDPGGVVTIPESVVTGEDGLAAFKIKYAKDFGTWVDVEIRATTPVSGDISSSQIEVPLSVMEGDEPFPRSPFGE